MSFYNNYLVLCNSVGKTPSAVALEIGFSKSTVSRWKAGQSANDATLQKVADYFGCTLEDLTAEAEKPAPEIGNEREVLDKIIDNMSKEELLDFIAKATEALRDK